MLIKRADGAWLLLIRPSGAVIASGAFVPVVHLNACGLVGISHSQAHIPWGAILTSGAEC